MTIATCRCRHLNLEGFLSNFAQVPHFMHHWFRNWTDKDLFSHIAYICRSKYPSGDRSTKTLSPFAYVHHSRCPCRKLNSDVLPSFTHAHHFARPCRRINLEVLSIVGMSVTPRIAVRNRSRRDSYLILHMPVTANMALQSTTQKRNAETRISLCVHPPLQVSLIVGPSTLKCSYSISSKSITPGVLRTFFSIFAYVRHSIWRCKELTTWGLSSQFAYVRRSTCCSWRENSRVILISYVLRPSPQVSLRRA